jgi:D-aminopeptidase
MSTLSLAQPDASSRPRARDIGLAPGVLKPGPLNAITDVAGVLVGQVTIWEGDNVRTGVTAILPHGGNLFQEKVPGAIYLGNAFGKLVGYTQVQELGFIETPIVLTSTLSVWEAADAVVTHLLALPGSQGSLHQSVIGRRTGYLNDIRGRHVEERHVLEALRGARGGPVAEGVVGAGTGTVAFGWKGGIGTSSRLLPESLGGYTVGLLVQSNYGGILSMDGLPLGVELGRYYLKDSLGAGRRRLDHDGGGDGCTRRRLRSRAPRQARDARLSAPRPPPRTEAATTSSPSRRRESSGAPSSRLEGPREPPSSATTSLAPLPGGDRGDGGGGL